MPTLKPSSIFLYLAKETLLVEVATCRPVFQFVVTIITSTRTKCDQYCRSQSLVKLLHKGIVDIGVKTRYLTPSNLAVNRVMIISEDTILIYLRPAEYYILRLKDVFFSGIGIQKSGGKGGPIASSQYPKGHLKKSNIRVTDGLKTFTQI